jgi:hypothetical protein
MKEYITALLVSALTVIAPIKAFVITIGLFVLFDTAFAIYWTVKTKGWSSFRSNKLFNLVIKSFFYMTTVMLSFLVDTYIFEGSILGIKLLLCKSISMLWIYIELVSINETSMKLGNKSIWVLFKELFAKGKELKKDLGEIIEDKKD